MGEVGLIPGEEEKKERAGKTHTKAKKQPLLQKGKYFLGIPVVKRVMGTGQCSGGGRISIREERSGFQGYPNSLGIWGKELKR